MSVARIRSPGYPSSSLTKSIDLIRKIYDKVRRNLVDRETIANELGYSGITGASLKIFSDLTHFGLLERAKGSQVRVSELAISILLPKSEAEYIESLENAAFNPELFKKIHEQYPDGHIVDSQIKSFLKRLEFSETALTPAVNSFRATMLLLESAKSIVSDDTADGDINLASSGEPYIDRSSVAISPLQLPPAISNTGKVTLLPEERVIFSEELDDSNYVKLVLSGEIDELLIDALEDYVKRLRKRIVKVGLDN
jgi:hypothetical protein